MHWNYCPECGHRIYQHTTDRGCQHVTETPTQITVKVSMVTQLPPDTHITYPTELEIVGTERKVCDCEVNHPELVHT